MKKKLFIAVVCLLLVAAMVLAVLLYFFEGEDDMERNTDVIVKSEHYSVTVPMMSYMVAKEYHNLASQYQRLGLDLSYMGVGEGGSKLDVNKPFKEQIYSVTTDEATGNTVTKTWFDYFAEWALPYVEQILALCEQASAAGFTLSEADHEEIRAELDAIDAYAELCGYAPEQYIREMYGSNVQRDDVKDMIELEHLATRYSEVKSQEFRDGFAADANGIETYYTQNSSDYDKYMDFYCFTFEAELPEESGDSNAAVQRYNEKKALYRDWVESLNACSSFGEFSQLLSACIWAYENDADLSERPDTPLVSREALEGMIYVNCGKFHAPKVASTWLFERTRVSGDHCAFFNEQEGESSAQYTIVWVTQGPHRSEEMLRSAGHILLQVQKNWSNGNFSVDIVDGSIVGGGSIVGSSGDSLQIIVPSGGNALGPTSSSVVTYATREEALAKAEEILAELEAAGGLTQVTGPNGTVYKRGDKAIFESIGAKYNCDSAIFYDDIYRRQWAEEFDDWVFSASRTEGEVDVIETYEGIHIMYYVGEVAERWFVDVLDDMCQNAQIEYIEASVEAYPVTVNKAYWDDIEL